MERCCDEKIVLTLDHLRDGILEDVRTVVSSKFLHDLKWVHLLGLILLVYYGLECLADVNPILVQLSDILEGVELILAAGQ